MKRAVALILLLTMLLSGIPVSAAAEDDAFNYFASAGKNLKGQTLNPAMTRDTGYLVFGEPGQVPGNSQKDGQWRYFGFDIMGNPFSNGLFPNDADSGRQPWEKQWIENPWETKNQGGLFLCKRSEFWRDPMSEAWLDKIAPAWPGWDGAKLHDYLNIQSPPTKYTAGSARGWHKDASGKVWYQTFVLAPLSQAYIDPNDLAATDLKIDGLPEDMTFKAGDTLSGSVYFANNSPVAIENGNYKIIAQLLINGEEAVRWDMTDMPAKTSVPREFGMRISDEYAGGDLTIEARINMIEPREFEETYYDNNTISMILGQVTPDAMDLEVTKITASQIRQGQDYTTVSVFVRNNSAETEVVKNPVRLLINGKQVSSKEIDLAPKASTQVMFRVDVPGGITGFTAIGEINHNRSVTETNYTNNRKSLSVSILPLSDPGNCSTATTTWTEYRSKDDYKGGDVVKEHYVYIRHRSCSGTPPNRTCDSWTEERLVGYTVKFSATLHTSVNVTPDKIKSGYGVDITARTWVTTDYDKPGSLSNAQSLWAYTPSGAPEQLEAVDGDTSKLGTVTWRLPAKVRKALLTRNHYIPVSWPDGAYKITIKASDVAGPANSLCRTASDTITIKGNMHEDDYTGGKGGK